MWNGCVKEYQPFSTSFFGLAASVPAGLLAVGVLGGFNDKSLIDGKLSRTVSLSDIFTLYYFLFLVAVFGPLLLKLQFNVFSVGKKSLKITMLDIQLEWIANLFYRKK